MTTTDSISSTPFPLGRRAEFDEQSKRYRLAPLLAHRFGVTPEPFSKCWAPGPFMDQGQQLDVPNWDPSGCTGFSRAQACNAEPVSLGIDAMGAFGIYQRAKQLDQWAGEDYEGSSVLAAVKAAEEDGYIASYWWALTYEEFVSSISNVGPGVVGSDWLQGMFSPNSSGFISPTGPVAGGHAYCIGGVIMELNAAVIYQSWGPVTNIQDTEVIELLIRYGLAPAFHHYVMLVDLGQLWDLMQESGEYCVSLDTVPIEPLPDPAEKGCLSADGIKSLFRRS